MNMPSVELKRGWFLPTFSVLLVAVGSPIAATAWISGKSAVEKMLTCMVQPLFVAVIAGLIVGIILTRRNERRIGCFMILGAGALWILSSEAFVASLFRQWESTTASVEPPDSEPFDYLVVLGGGTSVAPNGRVQFNLAGDRVGYAARLFLAGKTKHLLTTGDNLVLTGTLSSGFQTDDDPSQQTKRIWMDLGIPAEAISELPGENTSSEIASLRARPEYWKDKRCAILTSALHMPRAMQLAARAGITVMPIAADYRSGSGPLTVNQFIPEAAELMKLHLMLKEWIGMQFGR